MGAEHTYSMNAPLGEPEILQGEDCFEKMTDYELVSG